MASFKQFLQSYMRPYQKRFIKDQSNRIIVLKARQIGYSEVAIVKGLIECASRGYKDVYLASTSLRDSKELIHRTKKWLKVFSRFNPAYSQCKEKKESIEFPNGSRLMAVPAHAVRGKSGTIILDEVAFLQNCMQLWSDIAPAAESNPDLKIILISTPFGKRGLFYNIWNDDGSQYGEWSRHKVDIYTAYKEGNRADPKLLKERYPSDIFAQEFNCQFSTSGNQYFSHALLLDSAMDHFGHTGADYYGADWASTTDKSVLSKLTKVEKDDFNKSFIHAPEIIKPAGVTATYRDQFDLVKSKLDKRDFSHLITDGAGEGIGVSQDLQRELDNVTIWKSGDWRSSSQHVMDVKRDFENGSLFIQNDKDLIRAFASVKRKENKDKTISFKAERDKHGHSDEFFSSLMAYAASKEQSAKDFYFSVS